MLIALDWGISSLRAALLAPDGTVVDYMRSTQGILAVPPGGFPAVFAAATAPWRAAYPGTPALACGMIGSRQGWVEAPYASCPAGFDQLASALTWTDAAGTRLGFVPGLSLRDTDVMRGEETQIMGALAGSGADRGLFVLPGTHSKWASVEAGQVVAFRTFMTGEAFAAFRRHTILARLMPDAEPPFDPVAFADGCCRAGHGDLLHALFAVRTDGLFGRRKPDALPSLLSGMLVGEEVREALADTPVDAVHVIGEEALTAPYATALGLNGVAATVVQEEPVWAGLYAIARAAGLV